MTLKTVPAIHTHRAQDTRIVGRTWGTRTIEACACGAYRTFDVPHQDSPADLNDYAWSAWQHLTETERST